MRIAFVWIRFFFVTCGKYITKTVLFIWLSKKAIIYKEMTNIDYWIVLNKLHFEWKCMFNMMLNLAFECADTLND